MTNEQIEHMVQRFLGWRLPADFRPDGGVTFTPVFNEGTPYEVRTNPSGTNLLNYEQAKAMVAHMVEGMPAALTALTAARDESPRETDGWQPIETHSGDSCPVDLWLVIAPSARSMGWGDSFRVADAWRRGGGWVHLHGNECKEIEAGYITHWRPLPPPPSTGDGEVG